MRTLTAFLLASLVFLFTNASLHAQYPSIIGNQGLCQDVNYTWWGECGRNPEGAQRCGALSLSKGGARFTLSALRFLEGSLPK